MIRQFPVPSSQFRVAASALGSWHLEGTRMRRTTAILTVCLCALAGCRGSAAQEPYDGVIAGAQRPEQAAIPVPQAAESTPIASDIDVPWTIALLSNAKSSPVKKTGKVIVAETDPDRPGTLVGDADLRVAIDPGSAEEKPATPKTCSGVVNRRS
jgi:glucose/arabinose dehydrogenase